MRISDWSSDVCSSDLGYSCVAELRTVETIRDGKPQTPFLRFGSQVRIEMRDGEGQSLFGAIEQAVKRSEEHTSELQSLMRISYAVFCLKKKPLKAQQLSHVQSTCDTPLA